MKEPAAAVLSVEELQKSFPSTQSRSADATHVVKGVSFDVKPGETLALVGESGAGKSTIGRLALRLLEPDDGQVRIAGQDVSGLRRRELARLRSHARMVFQDPFNSLDPVRTVGSSIAEPLSIHSKMSRSGRRDAVEALLGRVGMKPEHAGRYPSEFSGGQLQRVAIARAISTEPVLLVCDEPVAALDVSIQAQVLNLLADLQRERQLALLYISHDLATVRHLAHRIAVLYRGQIVELGTNEQIFEDPKHPYTKALLRSIPVPDPSRRRSRRQSAASTTGLKAAGGCEYVERCTESMEVCRTDMPTAFEVEGGVVWCHRP